MIPSVARRVSEGNAGVQIHRSPSAGVFVSYLSAALIRADLRNTKSREHPSLTILDVAYRPLSLVARIR